MEAAVLSRAADGRRGDHGRGGGRLPAQGRPPTTKLHKADGLPDLVLEPTPDILAELGDGAGGRARCWSGSRPRPTRWPSGPRAKLAAKGVDLMVANDVSAPGVGFDHDTNAVTIFGADGTVTTVPLCIKDAVAEAVLDRVCALLSAS